MAAAPMFSPLAHGCGSWDGDLEAKQHKAVLTRSLDGESYDHLEKRVHIPIRIKSQLSQIKSILREASKKFPEHSKAAEENLTDLIRLKTEGTEYSRPLGSVRTRPRTGVIRASKQQARPSLGTVRSSRFHQRAKSAPSSRSARLTQPSAPRIDATLPKTLTTRKGALMIFTSPKNVAFSVPEQRCYNVDPDAINMENWVTDLQSFKKLTNSVLQYGSEIGDDLESIASASDYDTSCFRFLRKDVDDRGTDYRLQPGGDFVFYLKDMKTKAAVRNVVSSLSFTSTPLDDPNEEMNEGLEMMEREEEEMEDEEEEGLERAESIPPKTEYLRPASSHPGSQAWTSRTETESISIPDATGSSQPTEATVRFASETPSAATPTPSHHADASIYPRPDTARSNRSVGSLRSATPLSFKELTASIKSGGYLGRPITSPYPPYSPHPKPPSPPPYVEEEFEDVLEEGEEIGDAGNEPRTASARSRSRQSSRQSSRPKSSRTASRQSQRSEGADDVASEGQSVRSRRSRVGSAVSRRSSPAVPSQQGEENQEEFDIIDAGDDDDWHSEDLAELGVEDLEGDIPAEEIDGDAGQEPDGVHPVPPRSQSRASSVPPRVYTPQTRSSRRSTPPPEGDEWPGLDDGADAAESRPGSGVARTSSAKSRQSNRSRPGTSGSARTGGLADQDDIPEEGEAAADPPMQEGGDEDTLQLVGAGFGVTGEQEIAAKSPSVPSRPSTAQSKDSPHPGLEEPQKPPTPKPTVAAKPTPPASTALPTPAPPPARVKSPVPRATPVTQKPKEAKVEEEQKPAKIDLSSLTSTMMKKPAAPSSIPKANKDRSPSPKGRKGKKGRKGGGSSPSRKALGGVEFIDNPKTVIYDEPSKDELDKMIQEELAEQLAEANINVENEEEKQEEKGDPNDTDRASVATDDEAIEQELKKNAKTEQGGKKSKKQLAKEKAALKESRRLEKQRREDEKKALLEKRRAAQEEKRRLEYNEQRKKMEIEEQLRDAEEEARLAEEEEEMARQMLQESRRAARDEREKRRKEEMEKKKEERERQREERRKMEEAARQREREMAERLATAAERRRMREEAEWEAEEREREERERREREEDEELRRMEEEEERIRELERQAEQEALERLVRERREAEERRRQAREEAERQKEEDDRKMREELKRLAEEEEKNRLLEIEAEKKRQEELEKIRRIQKMEEEARARVQRKLEQRRMWALRRRERNNEQRSHLNGLRSTQGTTRPWVFSYYVMWPRDTYEKRLPSKEKKRSFRPRPKPPQARPATAPAGGTPKPPSATGERKVQVAGAGQVTQSSG